MAFTWHGAARAEAVVNLGPLALIQPLLDQLDIAGIIDRHRRPIPNWNSPTARSSACSWPHGCANPPP
jgi:hypothetical protein